MPTAHPRTAVLGAVILWSAAASSALSAQSAAGADVIPVPSTAAPIRLDGRLDGDEWADGRLLPLVSHEPTFGLEPSESGEIRVLHDEATLYLSARFLVEDERSIQANSLTRDVVRGDDVFRVILDTFNDSENALGFETTPTGVRVDYEIASDGAQRNQDWNGHWDVATARDERGWYAEMAIPLSSLRYQVEDGRVVMGIIAARYIAARNELVTYPSLDPVHANAPFRPSIAAKIELASAGTRRPLYVTPYALGGGSSIAVFDDTAGSFGRAEDGTVEAGLDVKLGITSNLTLDATVNTDFAQVEADDEVVNLTRFSLFFPEKRQFFQERAGIFLAATASLGGPDRFFHSRRIGLAPDGAPLRIWGGTRLVGQIGQWDVGLIDMQTDAPDTESTENLGVFRLRRGVLNDESTVGAMLTTRLGVDGRENVAYLLDGSVRVAGREYVRAHFAQSFDAELDEEGLDGALIRVELERPGSLFSKGFAYRAGVRWAGESYNPGLGFTPRRGFTNPFVNVRWGWFPGASTVFRSVQPSLAGQLFTRNVDDELDSAFGALFVNYTLKAGYLGWLGVSTSVEDLPEALPLAQGAVVPAGQHTFTAAEFFLGAPAGGRFRMGGSVEGGEFFDGNRISVSVSPTLTVNEHLEFAAELTRDRIRFPDRDQGIDADILRLRVQTALDTHLSASAFVQYNRAFDAVVGNVRVRYHLAEGSDLFLVYNEQLNTDLGRVDPELPRSQGRTLLVKASYTLRN